MQKFHRTENATGFILLDDDGLGVAATTGPRAEELMQMIIDELHRERATVVFHSS